MVQESLWATILFHEWIFFMWSEKQTLNISSLNKKKVTSNNKATLACDCYYKTYFVIMLVNVHLEVVCVVDK